MTDIDTIVARVRESIAVDYIDAAAVCRQQDNFAGADALDALAGRVSRPPASPTPAGVAAEKPLNEPTPPGGDEAEAVAERMVVPGAFGMIAMRPHTGEKGMDLLRSNDAACIKHVIEYWRRYIADALRAHAAAALAAREPERARRWPEGRPEGDGVWVLRCEPRHCGAENIWTQCRSEYMCPGQWWRPQPPAPAPDAEKGGGA